MRSGDPEIPQISDLLHRDEQGDKTRCETIKQKQHYIFIS